MRRLRRLVPAVAALLAVLVAVQATDLVACADEATVTMETAVHLDAPTAPAAHDAPAPGPSHDGGSHGAVPDCLCHIVFAPLAVAPEVSAQPAPDRADFGLFVAALMDVDLPGLDPVPLAAGPSARPNRAAALA